LGIRDFSWGYVFVVTALAGMDLRGDGGNGDTELFKGVEASLCTPPSFYSLVVLEDLGVSSFECLDWVVQIATEIHRLCGGLM
jgi:hypothetical protein